MQLCAGAPLGAGRPGEGSRRQLALTGSEPNSFSCPAACPAACWPCLTPLLLRSPRGPTQPRWLAPLVQASRGRYWRVFLGVGAKRQPGLYEELVQLALAEAPSAGHEKGPAAAELVGSGGGRGASPRKPLKQHGSGGLESLGLPVVEVHADGSAQGALAAARAAAGAAGDPSVAQRAQHAQPQQHATFTVTSDRIQPLEPEGGAAGATAGGIAGAAAAAPAPVVAVAELPVPGTPAVAAASNAAAAAATDGAGAEGPADGLATPVSSGSGSAGRSPDGSACSSSAGSVGPPSSGGSWQAKDWLSQIEKDLHRLVWGGDVGA